MTSPAIFISYSHADRDWMQRVTGELAAEGHLGLFKAWDDREIERGGDWRQTIADALKGARMLVLLVSPDAIDSPFIAEEEVAIARSHGMPIYPIIIRRCKWREAKWLSSMQSLVHYDKALAELDEKDAARALKLAAAEIRERLESTLGIEPRRLGRASRIDIRVRACDRQPQVEAFKFDFDNFIRTRAWRPQLWLVHGHEPESLPSLVQRVYHEFILNARRRGADDVVSLRPVELPWPDAESQHRWATLCNELFNHFQKDYCQHSEDFSGKAFARIVANTAEATPTRTLFHVVHLAEPCAAVFALLRNYVGFLEEAALHELGAHIMIFVCLPYPSPRPRRLWSLLKRRPARRVEQHWAEFHFERPSALRELTHCAALPELTSVVRHNK